MRDDSYSSQDNTEPKTSQGASNKAQTSIWPLEGLDVMRPHSIESPKILHSEASFDLTQSHNAQPVSQPIATEALFQATAASQEQLAHTFRSQLQSTQAERQHTVETLQAEHEENLRKHEQEAAITLSRAAAKWHREKEELLRKQQDNEERLREAERATLQLTEETKRVKIELHRRTEILDSLSKKSGQDVRTLEERIRQEVDVEWRRKVEAIQREIVVTRSRALEEILNTQKECELKWRARVEELQRQALEVRTEVGEEWRKRSEVASLEAEERLRQRVTQLEKRNRGRDEALHEQIEREWRERVESLLRRSREEELSLRMRLIEEERRREGVEAEAQRKLTDMEKRCKQREDAIKQHVGRAVDIATQEQQYQQIKFPSPSTRPKSARPASTNHEGSTCTLSSLQQRSLRKRPLSARGNSTAAGFSLVPTRKKSVVIPIRPASAGTLAMLGKGDRQEELPPIRLQLPRTGYRDMDSLENELWHVKQDLLTEQTEGRKVRAQHLRLDGELTKRNGWIRMLLSRRFPIDCNKAERIRGEAERSVIVLGLNRQLGTALAAVKKAEAEIRLLKESQQVKYSRELEKQRDECVQEAQRLQELVNSVQEILQYERIQVNELTKKLARYKAAGKTKIMSLERSRRDSVLGSKDEWTKKEEAPESVAVFDAQMQSPTQSKVLDDLDWAEMQAAIGNAVHPAKCSLSEAPMLRPRSSLDRPFATKAAASAIPPSSRRSTSPSRDKQRTQAVVALLSRKPPAPTRSPGNRARWVPTRAKDSCTRPPTVIEEETLPERSLQIRPLVAAPPRSSLGGKRDTQSPLASAAGDILSAKTVQRSPPFLASSDPVPSPVPPQVEASLVVLTPVNDKVPSTSTAPSPLPQILTGKSNDAIKPMHTMAVSVTAPTAISTSPTNACSPRRPSTLWGDEPMPSHPILHSTFPPPKISSSHSTAAQYIPQQTPLIAPRQALPSSLPPSLVTSIHASAATKLVVHASPLSSELSFIPEAISIPVLKAVREVRIQFGGGLTAAMRQQSEETGKVCAVAGEAGESTSMRNILAELLDETTLQRQEATKPVERNVRSVPEETHATDQQRQQHRDANDFPREDGGGHSSPKAESRSPKEDGRSEQKKISHAGARKSPVAIAQGQVEEEKSLYSYDEFDLEENA